MCGSGMPRLTEEDHPNLTSHIKRRKECSDRQQPINSLGMMAGIQQNFILRPKTRKREDTRKRERADHIKPERHRHGLAQSAHVAHVTRVKDLGVVIIMARVFFFFPFSFFALAMLIMLTMRQMMMPTFEPENDRASGKEQQSFEEGMCNE